MQADLYGRLVMFSSEKEGVGLVACLQEEASAAFLLQYLTHSVMKLGVLTRLVAVVAWAVKKLRRYTIFAAEIKVVMPTAKGVVVACSPGAHLHLRAQVVDF